ATAALPAGKPAVELDTGTALGRHVGLTELPQQHRSIQSPAGWHRCKRSVDCVWRTYPFPALLRSPRSRDFEKPNSPRSGAFHLDFVTTHRRAIDGGYSHWNTSPSVVTTRLGRSSYQCRSSEHLTFLSFRGRCPPRM